MRLDGGHTGSAFQNACSARLVDTEDNVSCIHDDLTVEVKNFTQLTSDTINSTYFSVSSVAPGCDNEVEKGNSRQTNGPSLFELYFDKNWVY